MSNSLTMKQAVAHGKNFCVACREPIQIGATLCPHCHSPQSLDKWKTVGLTLKWLVGMAAFVLTSVIVSSQLNNLLESNTERAETLGEIVRAANLQADLGDYAGAIQLIDQALLLEPASLIARDTQLALAMRQVRKLYGLDGKGYNPIIEPLLPILLRATVHPDAAMAADALAHLGWAGRLAERKASVVKGYFEHALRIDPGNGFAHAMWASWCLQLHLTVQPCGEPWQSVRTHYDAAFESDRSLDYIKDISLLTLSRFVLQDWPEPAIEFLRILIRLNESVENISPRLKQKSFLRLRDIILQDSRDLTDLTHVVAPKDIFLVYQKLLSGREERLREEGSSVLAMARLNELMGNAENALAQFRSLRLQATMHKPLLKKVGRSSTTAQAYIDRAIARLLKLQRGSFGIVGVELVTRQNAERLGLEVFHGLLVKEVQGGSPADTAGIEPGDVILESNGVPVDARTFDFPAFTALAGETVGIVLLRQEKKLSTKVTLAAKEPVDSLSHHGLLSQLVNRALYKPVYLPLYVNARTGDGEYFLSRKILQIAPLSEDLRQSKGIDGNIQGAVVLEHLDASMGPSLILGDVISEIGGKRVDGPEDVVRLVQAARSAGNQSVPIAVVRNGIQSFLEITISKADEQPEAW